MVKIVCSMTQQVFAPRVDRQDEKVFFLLCMQSTAKEEMCSAAASSIDAPVLVSYNVWLNWVFDNKSWVPVHRISQSAVW